MMEYAERIAQAATLIKGIYNDVSREIKAVNLRLDALGNKSELSQKESKEYDNLQYRLDELEAFQNQLDQAMCALD